MCKCACACLTTHCHPLERCTSEWGLQGQCLHNVSDDVNAPATSKGRALKGLQQLCKAHVPYVWSTSPPGCRRAPEVARVGHVLGLLGLAEHALVGAQRRHEGAREGAQRGRLGRAHVVGEREQALQALAGRGEQLQVRALRRAPVVHLRGVEPRCLLGLGWLAEDADPLVPQGSTHLQLPQSEHSSTLPTIP